MENTELCPLCKKNNFAIFDDHKIEGLHQRLYCLDCGLIYISPKPKTLPVYDHEYNDYFNRPSDMKKAGIMACTIAEIIGPEFTDTRILEVGCGNGWSTLMLKQMFHIVVGHELDEKHAWGLCRDLHIPMMHGDFENDIDLRTFDFIYAGHVIEHSWQPNKFFQRCHSLLDYKGRILLDTPDPCYINKKPQDWHHFKTRDPFEHCCVFHQRTLAFAAEKNGFRVLWVQPNPTYQSYQILLEKVENESITS